MPVTTDLLTRLEPISALSSGRLQELSEMCSIERVSQGLNPFRMNVVQSEQLLYLLSGQIKLTRVDGATEIIEGGSDASRHALGSDQPGLEALAITDIQILRIDADLLDIMLTWDQLANYEKTRTSSIAADAGEWMQSTSVFSAESLKAGIFRMLPASNVEEMFHRMTQIQAKAGQDIIRQGEDGDYYYLIQSGRAEVRRRESGGEESVVAILEAGQAFGEEALVSGNKRNATVKMITDGILLRLGKNDFSELLEKPLLHEVGREDAIRQVQAGAQLLDVRTPAEFNLKHHTGAINIPLQDIREAMNELDREQEYLVYCQSGRRAAAATFILAQHGFKVTTLAS
jgi:CRP-like cAMP-binding protein